MHATNAANSLLSCTRKSTASR